MCGITGVYDFNLTTQRHEHFVLWSMEQMYRRGPDDEGFKIIGPVAMGFRRLAIRDTHSRANQPMYNTEYNCLLTFNGEIYNTEFLKSKLPEGIEFNTNSDTEVLLYCCIHLGVKETLPLLDGIFAFAFYDGRNNSFTLARDRCGVKPLYFGVLNNTLIYSSEYGHILCHEDFSNLTINTNSLGQYLQLGFIPDHENLFKHTYLLPHGYFLTIEKNTYPKLSQYFEYPWKILRTAPKPIEQLIQIIQSSVKEQLISDVPVGIFQSGGIDSSLVTYFSKKVDSELESFTIGVTGYENFDETKYSTSFSERLDIKNNIYNISEEDLIHLIGQNTDAFSEPFADFSSIPTLLLCNFTKKKATVALSGDGGDELFWGYPRNAKSIEYFPFLNKNYLRKLFYLLSQKIRRKKNRIPFSSLKIDSFLTLAYQKTFIQGASKWVKRIYLPKIAEPFFLDQLRKELKEKGNLSLSESMNVLRKIEFDFHLQRVLLKVDRASLYNSLEVRVPLLSNKMLKFSTEFDWQDCIKDKVGKIPLRQTLNTLVDTNHSILPKKGFTIPIDNWIRGSLFNTISERVLAPPNIFKPYFNYYELKALLQAEKNEKNGWLIWALFTLFEWHDNKFLKLKDSYEDFKKNQNCNSNK